ncbi:hypothetical protein BJ170DRAFT_687402 [Xylariales sp. AK1849]|nr:hypothetical protein BJ170DRAFT_687402 [Xylariales sp. AK1849]
MGIHSNKQEPQAHVGSIATQLVSPLEPGNSPNDTPDTSRRYFGNRASLVGPKRQDNHFISDNIRQQENSGQQQRGEHAEQAPSRSFAGLRRPALRNESITGHSRPTLEPMGQRDDDNDGDNDDDEDDDDDDDDDSRTESLEARLERVLNVVEDTGFDSIDSMALTYYTSEFSEDSTIHPMQSVSRTRRLRVLLSALQNSYKSWSGRGRSAYTEEMIRAAEAICSDELQALYGSKPQRRRRVSVASKTSYTNGNGPAQSNRNEIANRFRELLSSPEVADFIQKDKVVLKDLDSAPDDDW